MRLFALSDLHVNHRGQRDALSQLPAHPGDWILLVGDLCETHEDFVWTLELFTERFEKVIWVPGNHELWSVASDTLRGEDKYLHFVDTCRAAGVHTPEDGWLRWPGPGPKRAIVPMFLLYDYTFGPEGMTPTEVITWAAKGGIRCTDEALLHPQPYASREAWCHARIETTERLLRSIPPDHKTILVNHWTLRGDLVRLYRVPRFRPWCGTTRTEDWHVRYGAEVVVSGHLHMRATDWRDGVRFEEVSLGYPKHWRPERGAESYLRQILPSTDDPPTSGVGGPVWRP